MNFKSTGIRIRGTKKQIKEGLRRLRHVFYMSAEKYWIKGKKAYEIDCEDDEVIDAYIRVYFYQPNTPEAILAQLNAAYWDIQCLLQELGEAELEIQRLKGENPRPFDAVLGGNLQQNTRSKTPPWKKPRILVEPPEYDTEF